MLPNGDVVSVTYNVEVRNCSKVLEFICHIPAIKVFSLLLSLTAMNKVIIKKNFTKEPAIVCFTRKGYCRPKPYIPIRALVSPRQVNNKILHLQYNNWVQPLLQYRS